MAIPGGWRYDTPQVPHPYPLPPFSFILPSPARTCYSHLPGGVLSGYQGVYNDLHAFAWYRGRRARPADEPDIIELDLELKRGGLYADLEMAATLPPGEAAWGRRYLFTDLTARPTFGGLSWRLSERMRVEAETPLSRMARTPAPGVLASGPLTAREAVELILTTWAQTEEWLDWAPIPPLLLPTPTGFVEPLIERVHIVPPEGPDEEPPTMLSVLQEYLDPFSEYALAADYEGRLVVLPPHWAPVGRDLGQGVARVLIPWPGRVRVVVNDAAVVVDPGATVTAGPYEVTHSGTHITATGPGAIDLTVFWAPLDLRDRVISIRTEQTREVLANRGVVVNENRLEYVPTTGILPPATLTVWGARCRFLGSRAYAGWPPRDTQRLKLVPGDGILRTWDDGGPLDCIGIATLSPTTLEWVPSGPPVAIQGFVDIAVSAEWWGDQTGDFGGAGPMGRPTVNVRVPANEWRGVTLWPDTPGPKRGGPDPYLRLDFYPEVAGGVLRRVLVRASGFFADDRWGIPFISGSGDWLYGVTVRLDASANTWRPSNTRVVAVWDEPGDPRVAASRALWGYLTARRVIRTYSIDEATALALARGLVEGRLATEERVVVRLAPPWPGPFQVGALVQYDEAKAGVVTGWRYRERHEAGRMEAWVEVEVQELGDGPAS